MKQLLSIILIVSLFSCNQSKIDKPDPPENLISEKKMVDVLYDMSIVSAAKGVDKKLLENKGVQPDSFIYKKHNIDSAQFAKSNAYYAHNIETYQDIYTQVKNRLEADKRQFNEDIVAEKKERDSLNKARRKRDSINKKSLTPKDSTTTEKPGLLEKIDMSQR